MSPEVVGLGTVGANRQVAHAPMSKKLSSGENAAFGERFEAPFLQNWVTFHVATMTTKMTAPKHDIFCRDGSNHRGRSHAYASFSSFMTSDKCFAPSVPPAKNRIDKGRKKVLL